jgi:hypothetical protein
VQRGRKRERQRPPPEDIINRWHSIGNDAALITVSIIFLLRSEMVSCPLRSCWEICFQNHFPPSEELIICQSELNRSPFPSLSAAAGELDFVLTWRRQGARSLFHRACVSAEVPHFGPPAGQSGSDRLFISFCKNWPRPAER